MISPRKNQHLQPNTNGFYIFNYKFTIKSSNSWKKTTVYIKQKPSEQEHNLPLEISELSYLQ